MFGWMVHGRAVWHVVDAQHREQPRVRRKNAARRQVCGIVALGCLLVLVSGARAEVRVLPDVPAYIWHADWWPGCGPMAAGMIIGYWDAHGFDNLIPGANDWNTNQQPVKDMIASPGHFRDYYPQPDRVATTSDPYHPDDSVADFMYASRYFLAPGDSYESLQYYGLTGYTAYRGYSNSSGNWISDSSLWSQLVAAIKAARPVELFVASTTNGTPDHFVAAVGYDDNPTAPRYACYNTWDTTLHWYDFKPVQVGQAWGVRSGTVFDPGVMGGDANLDGKVDAMDLTVLATNWRVGNAGWSMGDFTADGTVDVMDLTVLTTNWRLGIAPAAGAPIPEPAGLTLLLVGAALTLGRGRHRLHLQPRR